jgi:hypothetical protein
MSVVKGENALLRAVIRNHVGHPVPVHVRELHHQVTAHLISLDEAVGLLGCSHALNVDLIEQGAVGSLLSQEQIGHAVAIQV